MLSIALTFIIPHCCMTSTSSASQFLSLRQLGDVGRLKNGVFMQEIAIMEPAGNVLKRIGYHHWQTFKLYMIDCRPHQACICIPVSLSVAGYGHITSRIGKSQVVFDSELLTQPVVSQLFMTWLGPSLTDELCGNFSTSVTSNHLIDHNFSFFRILQTVVLALCLMTMSMTVAFSQCNSRRLCLRM
jgi:hypothetical protein